MFKRILIFIATNIAFMVSISVLVFVIERVTGVRLSGNLANGYTSVAIYSLVVGFASAFLSLAFSRMIAKWSQWVRLVSSSMLLNESPKMQLVYATVDRIAKQGGITLPEVGIYESPEPNAFATGPTRNRSLVAVSSGLLETMNQAEIEWVIGHEMAHILNGDMVTMTLLQGVLNTIVIFVARILGNLIGSALARSEGQAGWITLVATIVLEIALGFAAMIVVMAFSRHREYRADLGSARYVGKTQMIAALKKLASLKDEFTQENAQKSSVAALQISTYSVSKWFSTHPPLEERIQALEARLDVV